MVAASDSGSTNIQRRQPPMWKRSMNMENRSQSSRAQRPAWNRKLSKRASESSRKRRSFGFHCFFGIGIELAQRRLVPGKPAPLDGLGRQGFTFG